MSSLSDTIFIHLIKILFIIVFPLFILISFAISRPFYDKITGLMGKYGREDVIKVLLMSSFTGLIKLIFQRM